jgi:hypothetical protein
MIGEATYSQLPPGASVERVDDLHVKGKSTGLVAYVLRALPE